MGAGTLSELLRDFETPYDANLLVGYDKADDASVYKISEDTAVINTTDFFPPIVDDPYMYGQIAATNSISDVYAMGGTPKLALNIMSLPKTLDLEVAAEILRGGYDKAMEAGVIITGGHTIHSAEPIYGLSVTGFVHPDKVLSNSAAKPGDSLILTKKLGCGIITTAIKGLPELVAPELADRVYKQMATLNKYAAQIMLDYDVHSCTDITGFGLMGHAYEMADGSGVSMYISVSSIPYYKETAELAAMGLVPEGAYKNRKYTEGNWQKLTDVPLDLEDILFDPQTSGGLLISLPTEQAEECLARMQAEGIDAAIIGRVDAYSGTDIYLIR